jgi:hypothetical protein
MRKSFALSKAFPKMLSEFRPLLWGEFSGVWRLVIKAPSRLLGRFGWTAAGSRLSFGNFVV